MTDSDKTQGKDDDLFQVTWPEHVINAGPSQIVRAFRLIEYCGPRDWVVTQIMNSINGRKSVGPDKWIEGKTIVAPEFTTELDFCVDQIRRELKKDD